MLAAAVGPTPLWYATRGSGYTALLLLTAVVVLGLVTTVRWSSPGWPRFLSQGLHRNLSLTALVFLVIHIATSIIDPFAGLSVRDAIIPAGASYRPLWLGLGVVGAELFVAIIATSLLRRHLSFGVWRAVHLLAYASWPVAVLHAIGTGSDTKALWAIFLVVVCVAAVAVALVWRLCSGWPARAPLRVLGIAASAAAVIALAAWTAAGPLQRGWARAAGTPANLLSGGSGTSTPPRSVPTLAAGLNDTVTGTAEQGASSVTVRLTDQRDPSLQLVIVANDNGGGTFTATRSGTTVCSVPAVIQQSAVATCSGVQAEVSLEGNGGGTVQGTLVTRQVQP